MQKAIYSNNTCEITASPGNEQHSTTSAGPRCLQVVYTRETSQAATPHWNQNPASQIPCYKSLCCEFKGTLGVPLACPTLQTGECSAPSMDRVFHLALAPPPVVDRAVTQCIIYPWPRSELLVWPSMPRHRSQDRSACALPEGHRLPSWIGYWDCTVNCMSEGSGPSQGGTGHVLPATPKNLKWTTKGSEPGRRV